MFRRASAFVVAIAVAGALGGCTVVGTPQADPDVTVVPVSELFPESYTAPSSAAPTSGAVPPPADAATMLCSKFVTLDRATRHAVIMTMDSIVPDLTAMLALEMCKTRPNATVREMVAILKGNR